VSRALPRMPILRHTSNPSCTQTPFQWHSCWTTPFHPTFPPPEIDTTAARPRVEQEEAVAVVTARPRVLGRLAETGAATKPEATAIVTGAGHLLPEAEISTATRRHPAAATRETLYRPHPARARNLPRRPPQPLEHREGLVGEVGAGTGTGIGEGGMWLKCSIETGGVWEGATENHQVLNECDKGTAPPPPSPPFD
jgi:hypothetical protein